MPNFKFNLDFVPIPRDFIEHIMPDANAAYVVIYVYIMFLATTGKSAGTADIAKKLGLIESDVVNAIKYWNKKGLLSGTGDNIIVKKSVDEELSPELEKQSVEDIAQIIEGNKVLEELCSLAQSMLGKTLASNDLQTIYWFYDRLGFSPEVISMLLEYCVSMDKRNMKYIEKVAITWHENNISTMEEAQEYITRASKKDEFTGSLRTLFGITDRNLSKTEKLYLEDWRDNLKMSADMVGLAYEYCIMATSKLSFPYINTILKRWAEQGIRTIPDAEREHEQYRRQASAGGDFTAVTDNIDEVEQQFIAAYSK